MRVVQIKAPGGKLLEVNFYKAEISRFDGDFVRGGILCGLYKAKPSALPFCLLFI